MDGIVIGCLLRKRAKVRDWAGLHQHQYPGDDEVIDDLKYYR